MTTKTDKPKTSRRHLLAGSFAFIPAFAVPAAGDAAPHNDAPLRALFEKWEPLNAAYVAANDAFNDAEIKYFAKRRDDDSLDLRELSPRAEAARRAAAITAAFKEGGKKDPRASLFKGEMLYGLGIPSDYFREEDGALAISLRKYFDKHIRPEETIVDFLREGNAEILAANSHNEAVKSAAEKYNNTLRESFGVDELNDAAFDALEQERATVKQIFAIPAQGLLGLAMKAAVWKKNPSDEYALSIINDILRLGGGSEIPADRLREFFS